MNTIASQFDLQTRLFRNVLEGIDGKAAAHRQNPNANHIHFLAGHLVFTRLMMKDFAGLPDDPRFAAFDKNMDPKADYLPLEEVIAKWNEIEGPISAALKNLPAEILASPAPFQTPMGPSMGDLLGFLMHHEAYHIGQLGILRKFAGQPAMSYK